MSLRSEIQLRWSDVDQNRHLRHSVYYDFAAMARFSFLSDRGLTPEKLEELKIGPILFREEAIFRREITMTDKLVITTEITKAREDYSRWTIVHHFIKNDDEMAVILTVEGAWIDMEKRKLGQPNAFAQEAFSGYPKSADFEWLVPKV